jgi:hypothetical protein
MLVAPFGLDLDAEIVAKGIANEGEIFSSVA